MMRSAELSGSDMPQPLVEIETEEKKLNTNRNLRNGVPKQSVSWLTMITRDGERRPWYESYCIAKRIKRERYYLVKNSGEPTASITVFVCFQGVVRYKTMNNVVHKDALPKAIKAKLGIR